jgi:tetratricopeptide (TPR) repeat protein
MRRYLGALLLATGLMLGPLGMACALANQDDPRLDDLFARLKATDDPAEVQQLNDQIWFIWLDSGREEIDALMLEGRRFVERGVLHSALGNFGFIIKLDPDYAEAWHRRASVHYRMGNFTSSIEDIERTLALEPRHFGALAGLGLIYLELGQERAALDALERALEPARRIFSGPLPCRGADLGAATRALGPHSRGLPRYPRGSICGS